MNKVMLSLMVIVLLFLSSCGEQVAKGDFYTNASELLINSQGEVLSFGLTLFSRKQTSEIHCIGLEGEDIDLLNYNVEILDNNIKQLDNYFYRGLHVKTLLITIKPKNFVENCKINRMHLNVDGEKYIVEFINPIKHDFSKGNIFSEELRIAVIPNEFSSSFINEPEQVLTYSFTATQDVVIEGISCVDYLNLSSINIRVNNLRIEDPEFPLPINAHSDIEISFKYTSDIANKLCYVITTIVFYYKRASDNKELSNEVVLVFDPIYPICNGNMSPIDDIVDAILQNE